LDLKDNTICGLRAIIEAIDADVPVHKVFLQRGIKGSLAQQLEHLVRSKKISSSYVPVEKLDRMSPGNHQGAVAQISQVAFKDFEEIASEIINKEKTPLFLLLDQITDVRNFGAILRTAECCGVHAVVVPKQGAAPLNQDAVKTSAGAAFRIPIARTDHLLDAVYYLQGSGIQTIAATEKAPETIYGLNLKAPLALIMGSEDRGISPAILKAADHRAKLPLLGEIGSLNVSVACGAFLYEILRQRL
jgi:23S rRNA (guanosine2251-2'-O)-methyltransferase